MSPALYLTFEKVVQDELKKSPEGVLSELATVCAQQLRVKLSNASPGSEPIQQFMEPQKFVMFHNCDLTGTTWAPTNLVLIAMTSVFYRDFPPTSDVFPALCDMEPEKWRYRFDGERLLLSRKLKTK